MFVRFGERGLLGLERAQKFVEVFLVLQLAQASGVGRGDVDRDVIRVRVDRVQGRKVILDGVFDGRVLILADIDADGASRLPFLEIIQKLRHADVVEAHAVEQRAVLR